MLFDWFGFVLSVSSNFLVLLVDSWWTYTLVYVVCSFYCYCVGFRCGLPEFAFGLSAWLLGGFGLLCWMIWYLWFSCFLGLGGGVWFWVGVVSFAFLRRCRVDIIYGFWVCFWACLGDVFWGVLIGFRLRLFAFGLRLRLHYLLYGDIRLFGCLLGFSCLSGIDFLGFGCCFGFGSVWWLGDFGFVGLWRVDII